MLGFQGWLRKHTFAADLTFFDDKEVLPNGDGIFLIGEELHDGSGFGSVDLDVDLH